MIGEDFPDLFRRMDTMMARMMSGMESGSFMGPSMESFMSMPQIAGMPKGMHGYRIVIEGGDFPAEFGQESGESDGNHITHDAHEPVPEVHSIGNEVKVIVELPGIDEDALRMDLRGDSLIIDAGDADRHYHTSAKIPAVDPASMQKSLKNGVLEVTFTAADGDRQNTGAPES